MNSTLSQAEKDQLRYKLRTKTFSADAEIARLVEKGYDEATAKALLLAEFKEYKQHLFHQKINKDKQDELQHAMAIIIGMLTLIGPVCDIREPVWYMLAFVAAGICGYFGAKRKPLAGIAASVVYAIVFPLAHNMYFAGRTWYIKIEIAIPMIMAAVPALIMYFILSKTVYANSDRKSYDY